MTVKDGKVEIYAIMDSETGNYLKFLKKKYGTDISKCAVCKVEIKRSERKPRHIFERIAYKILNRRYYTWNVGAFSRKAVLCDRIACMISHRMEHLSDK